MRTCGAPGNVMIVFVQAELQRRQDMNESVFLRLENLLKERGVNFGVLRHQPVFTSEEAAAVHPGPGVRCA